MFPNTYNFYIYKTRDIVDQNYVSTSVKSQILHLLKNKRIIYYREIDFLSVIDLIYYCPTKVDIFF